MSVTPEHYLSWLVAFKNGIQTQDPTAVTTTLSFMTSIDHILDVPDYSQYVITTPPIKVFKSLEPKLKSAESYGKMIQAYVSLIKCLKETAIVEAMDHSMEILAQLVKVAQYESTWICIPMITVSRELRSLVFTYLSSIDVDEHHANQDNEKIPLDEKLIDALMRPFKTCLSDKSDSKKIAVYYFANELFKCCFKFQKFDAASNIAKVLGSSLNLPPIENALNSHIVTYYYYTALIAIIKDDLKQGNELLTAALNICFNESVGNQESILVLLLPLKFITEHKLPSNEIWKKYPRITVFKKIFDTIRSGNLQEFDNTLNELQILLLNKKVYSVYLRLRLFVELSLIRKCYRLGVTSGDNKVHLDVFAKGFLISSGREYSLDEIESRFANLIYSGYVKGYISHANRVIVLSKKDAFPKLVGKA